MIPKKTRQTFIDIQKLFQPVLMKPYLLQKEKNRNFYLYFCLVKLRLFRNGSSLEFLGKGQEATGGGGTAPLHALVGQYGGPNHV